MLMSVRIKLNEQENLNGTYYLLVQIIFCEGCYYENSIEK